MPKAGETFPMLHKFFSPCIIFLILSPLFFLTCWVEGLSLIVTVPAEVVGFEVPTKESLCAHGFDWWPICLIRLGPTHWPGSRLLLPITHLPLSAALCCPPNLPPSLTPGW